MPSAELSGATDSTVAGTVARGRTRRESHGLVVREPHPLAALLAGHACMGDLPVAVRCQRRARVRADGASAPLTKPNRYARDGRRWPVTVAEQETGEAAHTWRIGASTPLNRVPRCGFTAWVNSATGATSPPQILASAAVMLWRAARFVGPHPKHRWATWRSDRNADVHHRQPPSRHGDRRGTRAPARSRAGPTSSQRPVAHGETLRRSGAVSHNRSWDAQPPVSAKTAAPSETAQIPQENQ